VLYAISFGDGLFYVLSARVEVLVYELLPLCSNSISSSGHTAQPRNGSVRATCDGLWWCSLEL
jgi:hypothetical protein